LRKTQASCNKLSAGPVNSFRLNFATETKVADRDSSPDSLGRNYGRYWQKKSTFLFAIGMSVSSHNLFVWKMLCHKIDEKSENNYVTITFVQFSHLAALPVGAYAEFTFKIRVFQRFRGGSGALFALVSTLHFGRLCPNYGRLCTFWGRKRASSCQLKWLGQEG